MNSFSRLFDTIVEGNFETREDGSVFFYPYAWSQTAYRLTGQEKQEHVRSAMRRLLMATMGGGAALSVPLAPSLTALQFLAFVLPALMAVFILAHQVLVQRLVGDCEEVEPSLSYTDRSFTDRSYTDRFRRQAEAMKTRKAWLLLGTNLLIFLSILLSSWTSVSIQRGWMVLGLSLFGVTTAIGAVQLYYSKSASTQGRDPGENESKLRMRLQVG